MEFHRPDEAPTGATLVPWLLRHVPATYDHLVRLRADIGATGDEAHRAALFGNPYTVLSEAFYWPVCVAVAESGTAAERKRLADVIERLLATPDAFLAEAVVIRVVRPLADVPEHWSALSPYAGPNLRWTAEHP